MKLRSGCIIKPLEERASNDPQSNPSFGTGPSAESYSGVVTNLRRIFSELSLSSDNMSAYDDGENHRAEDPSNSTSLLDRLSNLMGFGGPNPNTPDDIHQGEEEVSSHFANETLNRAPHVEIYEES